MRKISLLASLGLVAFLSSCYSAPAHTNAWLSYKYGQNCGSYSNCPGLTDQIEETAYYNALGVDPNTYTFSTWLQANGFPADGSHPDAYAIYGNLRDLQIGRDMNCVQTPNSQNVACYVTNYGHQPYACGVNQLNKTTCGDNPNWPNIPDAVSDAISGQHPFATVAMVFTPNSGQPNNANNVTFYAFKGDGSSILLSPALDGEGPKTSPRMCMACHGGTYDTSTHMVVGASFLPFDVYGFQFSNQANYTLEDQQEGLRKLNAIVTGTGPTAAILDFINGTYPAGVQNSNSTAVDSYIPSGWTANPTLYTGVVKPYCRTCHMAQAVTFTTYQQFQQFPIANFMCTLRDMPHAEIPYGSGHSQFGLWLDNIAKSDLKTFMQSQGVANCPY